MLNFISWILFGLIVGALARFVVPGRDPLGCLGTIALGVAGSLLGGFLGHLLFGDRGAPMGDWQAAGFIGSMVGAVLVLLLYRQVASYRTR